MSLGDYLTTPDQFESWLATKNDTTRVGEVCSGRNCPIARFLKDQYPWGYPSVGRSRVSLYTYPQKKDVVVEGLTPPLWLQNFITIVDKWPLGYRITARRAKLILETAKIGAGLR